MYHNILLHCLQEDVARQRGLSPATIAGHLADAMEAGYNVDYRQGTCAHSLT